MPILSENDCPLCPKCDNRMKLTRIMVGGIIKEEFRTFECAEDGHVETLIVGVPT